MNTASLNARSLLVHVYVATFIGNPKDKGLTDETESNHKIERNRTSVRKRIMVSSELNAILMVAGKIRKEFEGCSLPWFDGGLRLVPSAKFVSVKQRIDVLIGKFNDAVDEFIACYEAIKDADKIALNGAYDPANYPNREELRAKFQASIRCEPLPMVNSDWRVAGVDAEMQANIAAQVEKQTAERLANGQRALLQTTKEALAHLISRLKNAEATFKRNSIENVVEAAQAIGDLNVTEDATLANLSEQVTATLKAFDPEAIRDSKTLRNKAIDTCNDAMKEIEAAMAGIYV